MAYVRARQQWKRQPQCVLDVNWGNPLTRELVIAVNVASEIDAVSRSMAAQSGSSTRSATQLGRTYKSPSTQIAGQFTFAVNLASAFDCTLLAIHRCTTNNAASLTVPTINLDSAENVVFCNTGNQSVFSTTGNPSLAITLTNGALNALVGVKRVNSQESYLNGVLLDTSVTGNRAVGAITQLSIGRPGGGNNLENVEYALVAYWQRALSSAEVRAVSDNPWQVFRPQARRIYVNTAAAAGGVTYPQLERGIRGLNRGVVLGSFH